MVQNTCEPQNQYGPFAQTLFLGCSIMSFSASVGWNEQISEVTVQLVKDPCQPAVGSTKTYYNNYLVASEWEDVDPGFYGVSHQDPEDMNTTIPGLNLIGVPVYFRVADFEFSGLIQSWEEKKATSEGNPTYVVKIVDPREILDGTQLIVGNYSGSVFGTYNLLNVFGYFESLIPNCDLNPTYGHNIPYFYGGFGGAGANDNGMSWNTILAGIHQLTATVPIATSAFSPYGRLVYKGVTTNHTMGILPSDDTNLSAYLIDISQLPLAPSYYRFAGPNIGLLDAIKNVCADTGCDFYIELLPTVDTEGNIWKIIKIRTAYRLDQPSLTFIDSAIGSSNGLVSSSKGQESRNELMSQFIIGGNKEGIVEMTQSLGNTANMTDDIIAPFWGFQSDGDAIPTYRDTDGEMYFRVDIEALNAQLNTALAVTDVEVREFELKMALGGFDAWLSWSSLIGRKHPGRQTIWRAFNNANSGGNNKGIWDLQHVVDMFAAVGERELAPTDLFNLGNKSFRGREDLVEKDLQGIFNFIEVYAREYYGRKYMVRVPFVCYSADQESGRIIPSEEPTDSGWTDNNTVLGLPLTPLEFFKNDQGKVEPFFRFDNITGNKLDFTNLGAEEYGIYNNSAYIKAHQEDRFVYIEGTPRVVMSVGQAVLRKLEDENIAIRQRAAQGLALIIDKELGSDPANQDKCLAVMKALGGIGLSVGAEHNAHTPDAALVTLKSNVITYGPYVTNSPIPGKVAVEQDEGLVPWEYDGSTTMNLAGIQKANNSITQMSVGEMGNITIAGYPDKPLGGELGATTNTHLFENRLVNESSTYSVIMDAWTGTNGPNITGVSVEVGVGGVQTTYTMRTYTPQFGRFSRQNAERLKSFAKQRARYNRLFRLKLIPKQKILSNLASQGDRRGPFQKNKGTHQEERHSPHTVLMGQMRDWNGDSYRRTIVVSESLNDVRQESETYSDKAYMSLDGLLRPISVSGAGNFPRFSSALGGCLSSNSIGSQPPILDGAGGAETYNVIINNNYLNPVANPASPKHGTSSGHDFEMLGRGSTMPTGGLSMPVAGYNSADLADYASDYKLMALRAPLLLHGWGYDLNGKPVPNLADTEEAASGGTFVNTGLQDSFMTDWLRKPHTWPVAPVDLRLDRKRGVWVSPPAHRMIVGQLKGDLSALGTADAYQLGGETLWDADGHPIPYGDPTTAPNFVVTEQINTPMSSGDRFIAYYDPEQCKYYPLGASTADELFYFKLTGCMEFAQNSVTGQRLDWNSGLGIYQAGPAVVVRNTAPNSIFPRDWGPAPSGFKGLARHDKTSGLNFIVAMQEYAKYIQFEQIYPVGTGGGTIAKVGGFNIDYFWDGEDPGDDAYLTFMFEGCYPIGNKGIAVYDPSSSICTGEFGRTINYRVVEYDTPHIRVSESGCGGGAGDVQNEIFSHLVFNSGLRVATQEDSAGCKGVVTLDLTVTNSGSSIDVSPATTINVTSGLEAFKTGDCQVDIRHGNKYWENDKSFPVVTGVTCVEGTLNIYSITTTYDVYGHLKATGE